MRNSLDDCLISTRRIRMNSIRSNLLALVLATTAIASLGATAEAGAATAAELERDARQALQSLRQTNPVADNIARAAKATLLFPNIVKAGLVFGGSYGEGVLFKNGQVANYYNSVSGSWGLQAGAQSYSYVVFLMTDDAVRYLEQSRGWELGVGPTLVVVDEGVAKNLSTSSLQDDAYAFIFGQQGLMAGISIEGTKVSRIDP
jgi:lipid-binding SYLF domain-containing protein